MSTPASSPIRPHRVAATLRRLVVPPPGHTPNLFTASATLLSIAAVYCYFAGYIFCYYYYTIGFGVTLESLDLSPQFYFIRAYTALDDLHGWLVLTLLVLGIGAYLGGKLRTGIMLAVLGAAFPLLYHISEAQAGLQQMQFWCSGGNSTWVEFEYHNDLLAGEDAARPLPVSFDQFYGAPMTAYQLQAMSQHGDLAPLLETTDRIVVFQVPRTCHPAPPKHVYSLLRSDLKFIQTIH